jgi:hypothetical protein
VTPSLDLIFYTAIVGMLGFAAGRLLHLLFDLRPTPATPPAVEAARNMLIVGNANRNKAIADAVVQLAFRAQEARAELAGDFRVCGCTILARPDDVS